MTDLGHMNRIWIGYEQMVHRTVSIRMWIGTMLLWHILWDILEDIYWYYDHNLSFLSLWSMVGMYPLVNAYIRKDPPWSWETSRTFHWAMLVVIYQHHGASWYYDLTHLLLCESYLEMILEILSCIVLVYESCIVRKMVCCSMINKWSYYSTIVSTWPSTDNGWW